MVKISFRTEQRSIPARPAVRTALAAAVPLRLPPKARRNPGDLREARLEDLRNESVSAVYSAAGRHHSSDGRRPTGGLGGFPAIAYFCFAPGRLSHYPGTNVLSGRQSRSNGFIGHRSSRAPVRPNSRLESDDINEFFRELDDYAAV